jgi:hypothetical protein
MQLHYFSEVTNIQLTSVTIHLVLNKKEDIFAA